MSAMGPFGWILMESTLQELVVRTTTYIYGAVVVTKVFQKCNLGFTKLHELTPRLCTVAWCHEKTIM